jgi:hypothetical protein
MAVDQSPRAKPAARGRGCAGGEMNYLSSASAGWTAVLDAETAAS